MSKSHPNKILFSQVVLLLQNARQQVLRTVNSTMTYTYFEIGRMIVEEEQNGNERAEYGKQILKGLSEDLTKEFGKGFSVENLDRMRKFYQTYSISSTVSTILQNQIPQIVSAEFNNAYFELFRSNFKLTWSHNTFLMRIDNEQERSFL